MTSPHITPIRSGGPEMLLTSDTNSAVHNQCITSFEYKTGSVNVPSSSAGFI